MDKNIFKQLLKAGFIKNSSLYALKGEYPKEALFLRQLQIWLSMDWNR